MAIGKVSQSGSSGETVASVILDDGGPFPWRPRARVLQYDDQGTTCVYRMESPNFSDWSIALGGAAYVWRVEADPVRLVLSRSRKATALAQFTYSSTGTLAKKGDDVGELAVYRSELSVDERGLEAILCSALVPIAQSERMGRRYFTAPTSASRC